MQKTSVLMAGALTASLFAMNANAAWDGAYFGGSLSWIDAEERMTSDENDDPITGDGDGWGLGILWGYNHTKGNYLIGFEADISLSNADSKVSDWGSADSVTTDIDFVAHLRSRFGYAFGSFLPYVSLGVALASTDTSFSDDTSTDAADSIRAGLSYGLGVEWAASEQLRARLEYVRDEYGSEGYGSYNVLGDSAFGTLETDTFSLGLLYAF